MPRMDRLGKGNTTLAVRNHNLKVTYYHTVIIVTCLPNEIVLDTGGWKTASTKNRMNQASNQFNLGYCVYQKRGAWYVDFKGKTYNFDGDFILLIR